MEKKLFNIPSYVYFILVALIIIVLFPREGKFRYALNEGKPWQYGLITAPFDFPIFKSTEHLKREQDTILTNLRPYFQFDDAVSKAKIAHFDSIYQRDLVQQNWNSNYKKYIHQILTEIYSLGIVSTKDYDFLKNNSYDTFLVLEENLAISHTTDELFTIKSAYSYIFENCPENLSEDVLRLGDLGTYLQDNLRYDGAMSDKVKQEMLQQISPSLGMVQAGEKIVDRGEIVDSNTYSILRSLKQIYDEDSGSVQRQTGLLSGIAILVICIMACLYFYLYFFRKQIYSNQKNIIFLLSMLSLFVFLTEISISYKLFNVYIIPFAIIPIVVRTFFDSRTAQMTHTACVLICSLMVPFPFEFIILQMNICMVAIFVLKDLTQRSQLIKCAFYILLAYIVIYVGILLLQESGLSTLDWKMLLYFGINFLFVMFTYSFIYIVEKVFGYISNVTLVELSDINTPALTLLSENSPGTFQHSLQVSMLGTAAATKVGANPQLVRTGALYHDLGKMTNPIYFTENKVEGKNPHDSMTLEESARVITNHVPEGVKKAEEFNLPPAIIKFIQTHHGKGKAKYFYTMYKNQHPDEPINEEAFAYEGFNPDTKETAILMMADSVEAASRSLKDYSEETIRNLVNKIIDGQIADGLLNDAPLTFKNITAIKDVFVEKLMSVYHSRISYPELSK